MRTLAASNLLLVDLKGVAVLHVERIGVVCWLHPLSVEEESNTGHVLALTIAKGIHQFAELRGALDLKENLVVVIRHFDVEVLLLAFFRLLVHRRTVVGHVVCG